MATNDKAAETVITPWEVSNVTENHYLRLIKQFGLEEITSEDIARIEKLTGKPAHRFLRRNIFFAGRGFRDILDKVEKGYPFYLYTGRGPSGSLHLGHCIPLLFTQYLQEAFQAPLVIQMSDDEKFFFKGDTFLTLRDAQEKARENVKEIIALGFDLDLTFIFNNSQSMGDFWPIICEIMKRRTCQQQIGGFGFTMKVDDKINISSDDTCTKSKPKPKPCNVGMMSWPPCQEAPAFSRSFPHWFGNKSIVPCLIPFAVDQDPYFRFARDHAEHMKDQGYQKPSTICGKFISSLAGPNKKMSSSDTHSQNYTLFLTDSKNQIKKKINKYCISSGREHYPDQLKLGCIDLEKDMAFQLIRHLEDDDEIVNKIAAYYGPGVN